MENLILKSISVENFASFAEPIIFTTESDLSKKSTLTTHSPAETVDLIRFHSCMEPTGQAKHFSVKSSGRFSAFSSFLR